MYIKREIEDDIIKWLDAREIIALKGPRQSGKTTLLMRIKDMLEVKGIEDVHFINFEDDMVRLRFERDPKEFIKFHITSERRHYFLMDEVQYVKDAGRKFKLIFDSFDNVKMIMTGSSSFDLRGIGKYLVGRVLFFDIHPFSFLEFLKTKGEQYEKLYREVAVDIVDPEIKKTIFLDDLNKFLHEYLTFGGYPRIVLEEDRNKKKDLLRNLFMTYIEKDIVSIYGIKCREKVVILLKALSSIMGGVVNYETITQHSGLKYNEVREILPLLEDSFVISIIRPFYKNLMNELRKNPKIYFVDYGLRNHLTENFDVGTFDKLYENFVCNELKRNYDVKYWRTTAKTEVDFVVEVQGNAIPIEVKTSPKIARSLRSFIHTYHPKTTFIANLNVAEEKEVDNSRIVIVPFVYL